VQYLAITLALGCCAVIYSSERLMRAERHRTGLVTLVCRQTDALLHVRSTRFELQVDISLCEILIVILIMFEYYIRLVSSRSSHISDKCEEMSVFCVSRV